MFKVLLAAAIGVGVIVLMVETTQYCEPHAAYGLRIGSVLKLSGC